MREFLKVIFIVFLVGLFCFAVAYVYQIIIMEEELRSGEVRLDLISKFNAIAQEAAKKNKTEENFQVLLDFYDSDKRIGCIYVDSEGFIRMKGNAEEIAACLQLWRTYSFVGGL